MSHFSSAACKEELFIKPQHLRQANRCMKRVNEVLVSLIGDLKTVVDQDRRGRDLGRCRRDHIQQLFKLIIDHICRLFRRNKGRALCLSLEQRSGNSVAGLVEDPNPFANATNTIEIAAALPSIQFKEQFPQPCKRDRPALIMEAIARDTRGTQLVHVPNPPPQISVVENHVYFFVDQQSLWWRDFSMAPALGMYFAGVWPRLELALWAVPEER